jgi:hypothetical protein
VFVLRTSSTPVATWFWQTEGRSAKRLILGVRPSEFILSEFQSPSRRIFIGSHSLPTLWPHLLVESSTSVLWLNRVTQWFSGEPLQTPRTRCSLRQSPLMTRLPRSPGSTLVLRLYEETVHDFILLFMPPCGPHLTPLATGSLERSLLVFSTPGGLTGNDLHQHESSRNLHLQYLAKSQSTQRCQSLITQGSDHPPVLEPHMVLTPGLARKPGSCTKENWWIKDVYRLHRP